MHLHNYQVHQEPQVHPELLAQQVLRVQVLYHKLVVQVVQQVLQVQPVTQELLNLALQVEQAELQVQLVLQVAQVTPEDLT